MDTLHAFSRASVAYFIEHWATIAAVIGGVYATIKTIFAILKNTTDVLNTLRDAFNHVRTFLTWLGGLLARLMRLLGGGPDRDPPPATAAPVPRLYERHDEAGNPVSFRVYDGDKTKLRLLVLRLITLITKGEVLTIATAGPAAAVHGVDHYALGIACVDAAGIPVAVDTGFAAADTLRTVDFGLALTIGDVTVTDTKVDGAGFDVVGALKAGDFGIVEGMADTVTGIEGDYAMGLTALPCDMDRQNIRIAGPQVADAATLADADSRLPVLTHVDAQTVTDAKVHTGPVGLLVQLVGSCATVLRDGMVFHRSKHSVWSGGWTTGDGLIPA